MSNLIKIETDKKFGLIRKLKSVPLSDRHTLSIKDLKKDSFIRVFKDTYIVDDVYTYQDKEDTWTELKLINVLTLEVKYLEIEEDDEIELSWTEKEISMKDLPDVDTIEDMADEESGQIKYAGNIFYYDDDYKAKFIKKDKKEKVYFYDFLSDDKKMITIEEWGSDKTGYSYQAFLSFSIPVEAVEILSL